jgi:outer membrane murein-binding lipoprotein Lpp
MMLVAAIAALALAVILLAGTICRQRLRSRVSFEVNTLFSGVARSIRPEQLAARYDGLPEPVRRYLHYAVSAEAPAT